jgi:hypothetical protein
MGKSALFILALLAASGGDAVAGPANGSADTPAGVVQDDTAADAPRWRSSVILGHPDPLLQLLEDRRRQAAGKPVASPGRVITDEDRARAARVLDRFLGDGESPR